MTRVNCNAFLTLWRGLLALILAVGLHVPLAAQDGDAQSLNFDGLIELRGIESDFDFNEGPEIDTSGVGARIRLGAEYSPAAETEIRVEGEARVFEFRDDDRGTLDTYVGRITVAQQVSDQIQLRAHARRFENIPVVEALSADQTSIGGRVQWQKGNDRVRLDAEYRIREYDTQLRGDGEGVSVSAQYNRRFGSFHWLRFDVRHDEIQSDNDPIRSYDRQSARVRYSHPIHKRIRLIPAVEYRQWEFDSRIAQGDPEGDLRRDSFVAPRLEVSAGRVTRGLYGSASVEYRLRTSNDERFDMNSVRIGVRLGYRF